MQQVKNVSNIKLPFYLVSIAILTFLFGSCDEKSLNSKFVETSQIITDGLLTDWDNDTFFSFEDKIKVAVCNDKNYIYLAGEFLDKNVGRNFALSGITFLINPSGDKNESIFMLFYYPGTKKINYSKGGFFTMLTGDQKIKALRNLDKISNSVLVFDTTDFKSYVFKDTSDSPFQGKMNISDNKLSFELKFPIQINNFFESYSLLNRNSLFCLQAGNLINQMNFFPRQMNFQTPSGGFGKMNGKPKDMKENDFYETQFWFTINTNEN